MQLDRLQHLSHLRRRPHRRLNRHHRHAARRRRLRRRRRRRRRCRRRHLNRHSRLRRRLQRFSGVGGGSRSPRVSKRRARRGHVERLCAREVDVCHGRFDFGRLSWCQWPLGAGGGEDALSALHSLSAGSAHSPAQEGVGGLGRRQLHAACVQKLQSVQGNVPRRRAAVYALPPAGSSVRGCGHDSQARMHQLRSSQGQVRPQR
mmetsp:Transcript_80978/g.196467  ORF Transcript_80978/g.196467 Transcript_80978/m.196467 type:complete len:204 (-) Transcript_80978:427-1038(-)